MAELRTNAGGEGMRKLGSSTGGMEVGELRTSAGARGRAWVQCRKEGSWRAQDQYWK